MRFPEFIEVWEETILSDLGTVLGGGTPSSANSAFWSGTIPWISSSDLQENDIHNIRINRFITLEAINGSATKFCPGPVILIISRVGVGKVAYSEEGLCTSQDFTNIIDLKCNGLFLSYVLVNIMKAKASSTQGTSIKGITSAEIKNIKLHIPKSEEQQKIAAFLSLIDQRIETQNKIIEKLETLIKGLNYCIFNQQLRFSGFSEVWGTYRITDFLEFFSTNSLSWEALEYGNGRLYNLHYGLIHQNITRQIDLDEEALPYIKTEFLPNTYSLCQDGDVAFADASEDTEDVGKVVEFVNCGDNNIVCGLHTIHGRDKKNLTITKFKSYIFSSSKFRSQIRQLAQGTKVFSINQKTFNECFIEIPSKVENVRKLTPLPQTNLVPIGQFKLTP